MAELVTGVLMVVGACFALLAGIGITRLPDLFTRMQAATKAAVLGAGSILLALAVYFGELGVAARALATIAFIGLTAPIASHIIARAAYMVGVPLWSETIIDELQDKYSPSTHELSSGLEGSIEGDISGEGGPGAASLEEDGG
jgi:multicomponent Na+:H+ antiporter subunit G